MAGDGLRLIEPAIVPDVLVGKIKEIATDTYLLLVYRSSDEHEVALSVVASGDQARNALFLISDFITGSAGIVLEAMMH